MQNKDSNLRKTENPKKKKNDYLRQKLVTSASSISFCSCKMDVKTRLLPLANHEKRGEVGHTLHRMGKTVKNSP